MHFVGFVAALRRLPGWPSRCDLYEFSPAGPADVRSSRLARVQAVVLASLLISSVLSPTVAFGLPAREWDASCEVQWRQVGPRRASCEFRWRRIKKRRRHFPRVPSPGPCVPGAALAEPAPENLQKSRGLLCVLGRVSRSRPTSASAAVLCAELCERGPHSLGRTGARRAGAGPEKWPRRGPLAACSSSHSNPNRRRTVRTNAPVAPRDTRTVPRARQNQPIICSTSARRSQGRLEINFNHQSSNSGHHHPSFTFIPFAFEPLA